MQARPNAGAGLAARAVLLAAGLHFATGALLGPLARPYAYSDFATFYSASRSFASGLDPYDSTALRASGHGDFPGWIGGYYYPPPFAAVAVRPLAALPFGAARRIWVLFEAAAFVGALALLAARLTGEMTIRAAAVATVGLLYAPMTLDLRLGSVSGLLLLLVALFLREWHSGHRGRAALCIAAASLLKLAPALVLVYLALRREWKFALRAVATGAALALVCLPWTGFGAWAGWATRVVPYLMTANFSWFTNQSIDAFFWRLFVPNPDTTPWLPSPGLQRAAAGLASLLLLAVVLRLAWRSRGAPPRGERFDGELGLVLVVAVLVSRVAWEYLTVLALPAFVFGVGRLLRGEVRGREVVLLALAWALCALPFPYAQYPPRHGIALLLAAPRTYGLLLLVLFAARLLEDRRAAEADATAAASVGASVSAGASAGVSGG